MSTRITHWIGGKPWAGTSERQGSVYDPATGRESGRVDLASAGVVDEAVRSAAAAAAEWRNASLTRRTQVVFAFRELLNARKERAGRDHHRRARQGALRRARRGRPRPGGRRVRLRHPAPAQGRLLARTCPTGVDVHSIRQPLGVVGDHQPVQLPGHGADVVLPGRDRGRQHAWCSSPARRTRRPPSGWPSSGRRPACPTASSTSCTATRRPSTRCSSTPTSRSISLRRLDADRRVRLRARHQPTASGCRRSAGRRTTWSCCPTPTSTWPPTPRSTPGFGSAGERCMAISAPSSRSARSATSWSPRSPSAMARSAHRRRHAVGCRHGPARHRRAPRQGGVATSTRRGGRGASWSSTAATSHADGDGGRLLARPDAVRPRDDRTCRSTATRSSGRCCRVVRVRDLRRGARAGQRQPLRQRRRRSSPTTAGPPGASRTRSRSGMVGDQRARSRCRWPTTPSAAGRTRCSATPTRTASRACTSSPAARWSRPAGSTRATAGIELGFPTQILKGNR